MERSGLSSGNRNLLVAIFFIALLLYGPIDPYGIIIRIAYLIILPTLLWFSLRCFGNMWKTDKSSNSLLTRGVIAMLAGAFFVSAYLSFTRSYHSECTQSVQTRDGNECVGDYVSVPGSDKVGGVMLVAFGIAAAWYAISKQSNDSAK